MEEIIDVASKKKDRFERMKRYEWFNLDLLKNTKVLVVGAGALGNEVCKNLVLSGIRNISIVDMDYVVFSNLNRCIFFSEEDAEQEKYKVKAIAEKLRKVDKSVDVKAYVKKIEDMPDNFIAFHDIVLGCLDNVLARLYLNSHCYCSKIPYIDGATHGMVGKVHIIFPPETSCLECGINETHVKIAKLRFSCSGREITIFERKLPADINTTSIIAAVQVQEALKIIHGRNNFIRNVFYYDGERNYSEIFELPINQKCPYHKR